LKKKKEFKILSIDGGGIKGLYSATILKEFEEKFDCHISDYFDMICGTSTGGLIALALSLKIPAKDICEFYNTDGDKIFPTSRYLNLFGRKISRRILKQLFYGGKYSDVSLKKALEKVLGNNKIGDSNNLLCIPSYTITEARPFVYKYDHPEGGLDRDNGARMVDVALATSAAPTFFPLAENPFYDNKQFIDGGVWANNPTLVGLLEALDYFVGDGIDKKGVDKKFSHLKILSISSLSITGGKPTGLNRNRSFLNWGNDLFETSMNGQSFFTHFFMEKIKTISNIDVDYVRIPSVDIASEQENLIQLDVATKKALDLMKGKGKDQADIYKKRTEIIEFFKEEKLYKIK
jgi:patatin-like phospholipase/acyl hydrolase